MNNPAALHSVRETPGVAGRGRNTRDNPDQGWSRSERVSTDNFPASDGGDRVPGLEADRVLDEPDRSVHENHIHAAGVIRTGRDHRLRAAGEILEARRSGEAVDISPVARP